MKRHWRLWLSLVTLLIAGALFLLPSVRWPVIGWAKGEAFYQGMPTSYWHSEIQNRYEQREQRCHGLDGKCGTVFTHWERQPSAWEEWLDKALARSSSAESRDALWLKAEEEAIPILKELFVGNDIKVRRFVADKLMRLGSPSLYPAAESEDEEVRQTAIAEWKFAPW